MPSISISILIVILSAFFGEANEHLPEEVMTDELYRREVASSLLVLKQGEGLLYEGSIPFTGVSVSKYPHGQVAEKITYDKGRRNGPRKKWFDNGDLSYEANYQSNKLDGVVKTWWANGAIRSEAQWTEGKLHGVQKQWYSSGQLFKELNMVNGNEEGLQRAWRENGKIYINYEAKNGRIFGLKRSNLCFELNDETIVFDE